MADVHRFLGVGFKMCAPYILRTTVENNR